MGKSFTIGSAIALVGLIAWLFIRIEGYKDAKNDQLRETNRLEWLLSAKEAENDSIKLMAEYSEPDTIWDSIPVPYAVYDTVTGDSIMLYKKVPWAKLFGSVKFDTTVKIGPELDSLKIRVKGWLYYPKEYEYLNRLLIYPVMGPKTPYLPPERSQAKRWGLGLSYLRSFSGANASDYFGGSVRYKRLTFVSGYDPWRKSLISGLNYEILSF